MTPVSEYRIPLNVRPKRIRDGEIATVLSKRLVEKSDERAMGAKLVCNRRLFGDCYHTLAPRFFDRVDDKRGVMIASFVSSTEIFPDLTFPGDIDLLVIPYFDDELIISETLAIELKVVRASFAKQGKSPNDFGFSQSKAMFDYGLPYSALAHLITSDTSPEENRREMLVTRVVDADAGIVEPPWSQRVDMLPSDLIARSYGRLKSNCDTDSLGLLSTYVTDTGIWTSEGRAAARIPKVPIAVLDAIARFYKLHFRDFFDTPRN
jgi:hypothetical protein